MKNINRVVWIVLDSVGMGELPDAARFGDVGSDTIGNVSKAVGGLKVPNLISLGLGNIDGIHGLPTCEEYFQKKMPNGQAPNGGTPMGCYGRLAEVSNGKDTTIGHWEMVGVYSKDPFPTYPDGFPKEIIDEFVKQTGVPGILCNKPASGTVVLEELGDEHKKTGKPIIYTSADSVFQIACHEDVVPVEKLYEMCRIARKILVGKWAVARVIARPFVDCASGKSKYERTSNRRDFSLHPPKENLLVEMKDAGLDVIAVGKIEDIFAGEGITRAIHTKDNQDGIDVTIEEMKKESKGLIFTNLVEFDSKWGHRNDYVGYAKGLEEFDERLPEILAAMKDDDLLVITADHGCDPTTPSTDHSREYVPLVMYSKAIKANVNLRTGKTYANIGQTVADLFGLPSLLIGESFKELL